MVTLLFARPRAVVPDHNRAGAGWFALRQLLLRVDEAWAGGAGWERFFVGRGALFPNLCAKVFRGGGDDGGDLGVDLVVAEGSHGVAEAHAEGEGFFAGADLLAAVGADEVEGLEERGVGGVDGA